jgi:hypothetical protein
MVRISKSRSYSIHARSLDRNNPSDTPSSFSLTLADPLQTVHAGQYMKASLLSACIPSSFYQIGERDRYFTVGFNRPDFSVLKPYLSLPVVFPDGGKPTRADYEREVVVKISKGNYSIEELLVEIKVKLNAACASAHATRGFRTFIRTDDMASAMAIEDMTDAALVHVGTQQIIGAPQFDWTYNKQLNKMKLYRTDTGGKVVGGKWDIQTTGRRLGFCLGFSHVTAQMIKQLGVSSSITTTVENSFHYRESPSDTEYNDFAILKLADGNYGHAVYSTNTINMYHDDQVFMHSTLPSNGMETLSGTSTSILAIIPMTSGSGTENFYIPTSPTSTTIDGASSLSQMSFRFTDAQGHLIDFEGGELSFSILFECFDKGSYSDKPPDQMHTIANEANKFGNIHQNAFSRHSGRLF